MDLQKVKNLFDIKLMRPHICILNIQCLNISSQKNLVSAKPMLNLKPVKL